jgi:HAD superfamily hydrolase (TIGR01484 family)
VNPHGMQPLADWPRAARRQIRGVFTDIDDTLTTTGAITDDALTALHEMMQAGIPVIAITGRSVGWCMPKISEWPLLGMGAESGAVLLLPPPSGSHATPEKRYRLDADTRAQHQTRMQAVAHRVLQWVPEVQIAPGAEGRETDIAFDHHEYANLSDAKLAQVRLILLDEGLTVAVSSIHIHGCVGAHDKFAGARWIVRTLFDRALEAELAHWAFVGDSANDESMFHAFGRNAIGVANVRHSAGGLRHWPHYITQGARGAGFAEVARALIEASDN